MAKRRPPHHKLNFLEDLSDYKVASDDPDVRGWELVDRDNHTLGKVEHLLADVERKRVRYLDVAPDKALLDEDHEAYKASSGKGAHEYRDRTGEVHMIIPIGMARLDGDNKRVIADKVDKSTFLGSPSYPKDEGFSREHEAEVRNYYEDPESHRAAATPRSEPGNVAFKSEHHTKGNENIGSRDERVRRDVKENPGASAPTGETENPHAQSASTEDQKHRVKATPENTGKSPIPDHDERKPRTTAESRQKLEEMQKKESHLGEDPQVRKAQSEGGDVSDESREYRRERGESTEDDDFYRGENFDDERFYNRRK